MKNIILLFLLLLTYTVHTQEDKFNLKFNKIDTDGFAFGWERIISENYSVKIFNDSTTNKKNVVKIEFDSTKSKSSYAYIGYDIPNQYKGKKIKVSGSLKIDNLNEKSASYLYINLIDNNNQTLISGPKSSKDITGTIDWKKYEVEIDFDNNTSIIKIGAVLLGKGTLFIDDFKILIDGKPIEKLERERNIGYALKPILFKNVNYFNTEKKKFIKSSVLVSKGKIVKINKNILVSDTIETIDATDNFLIPGLIDSHIHLFQSGGLYTRPDIIDLRKTKSYEKEKEWIKDNTEDLLNSYLKLGITTVIDQGGPFSNFKIRDKYNKSLNHPSIFLSGPLVSTYQPKEFGTDDMPIIKVNTIEEAKKLVQKQNLYKTDFIKIWYLTSRESAEKNYDIVKATITEAHKNNLKVAVHATELKTAKLAIKAGANILVHSIDEKVDEELLKMIKENNVIYIPTLEVHINYVKVLGKTFSITDDDFKFVNPYVLGTLFDSKNKKIKTKFKDYVKYFSNQKETDSSHIILLENLKKVISNNIIVATGTDAGNIGTFHAASYYNELAAMKLAGLSNEEILISSTINGAKVLGKEMEFGSIEVGKFADLVLLNANPLKKIENLKSINLIVKRGEVHYPNNWNSNSSSQDLVQKQLNAYNARNIDAFLEPYADDVKIYNFPNTLKSTGKDTIRPTYENMFKKYPDLHCELVNRIINGDTIIDHERITFNKGEPTYEATAIYKIKKGKISKVYFIH